MLLGINGECYGYDVSIRFSYIHPTKCDGGIERLIFSRI